MITRRLLLALPVLLLSWIAVMALVMRFSDAAPGAVVLFPDAALLANLPEGAALTGQSAISVTLTSDRPGFARALYRAGAVLVLPAGLPGCLPLGKPPG